MKIGDRIKARPMAGVSRGEPMEGVVVYIHPEGRYYTLEFTYRRFDQVGRIRESFFFQQEPEETIHHGRHYGARGSVAQGAKEKQGHYINSF